MGPNPLNLSVNAGVGSMPPLQGRCLCTAPLFYAKEACAVIDSEQLKQHVIKAVDEIRATNPMAGSITNTVTIDFVANAQLAVGR